MARRQKGKYRRKYIGSRTCGGGNAKNRRGKGSRGGKGNAGASKQRWTYFTAYETDHFGGRKFISKEGRVRLDSINLSDLNRMVERGEIEKAGAGGARFAFDYDGKVLGAGQLKFPIDVTAKAFSKKAKERIAQAGGEAHIAE